MGSTAGRRQLLTFVEHWQCILLPVRLDFVVAETNCTGEAAGRGHGDRNLVIPFRYPSGKPVPRLPLRIVRGSLRNVVVADQHVKGIELNLVVVLAGMQSV